MLLLEDPQIPIEFEVPTIFIFHIQPTFMDVRWDELSVEVDEWLVRITELNEENEAENEEMYTQVGIGYM